MKRIALHKMNIFKANAIISTVQIAENEFETMIMFDDGEEIECFTTQTLEQAKEKHNETVSKWNDKIYDGSINKDLGFENYGKFVIPVVTC